MSKHRFGTITKASTKSRGYGAEHRRLRAHAASQHQPDDPCVRCSKPLGPMGPWLHFDHTDDRTGYLGFSCADCNRKAGARAGNRRSRRRRDVGDLRTKPSRDW